MAEFGDRIDPQPRWPRLDNPYRTAEDAFQAGNYPLALALSRPDEEIHACALVMGGAITHGLALLAQFSSSRARLVRAYGHWCLNEVDEARPLLAGPGNPEDTARANRFREMLDGPLDLVMIAMPGETSRAPYEEISFARLHWIQLRAAEFGTSMAECLARLPLESPPALIVSIDAYGPYVPSEPKAPGVPMAFWSSDHDYFFATRYADLSRADLIVANSAGEQCELVRHYPSRSVAFPGHETYRFDASDAVSNERKIDIAFSGRAFVPYMRDKAQYLFNIAIVDDPAARIEIVDGYLSDEAYAASLAGAKFVPVFWRSAGGLQTRAIEALRAGASVLAPERTAARPLLGDAAALYRTAADADIAAMIPEPIPNAKAIAGDLRALFWPSPAREERFLKFCLFQSLFVPPRSDPTPGPVSVPVELRGYALDDAIKVYTRLSRLNGSVPAPGAQNHLHAAAAAFYAAIALSANPEAAQAVGQMALDFYRTGVEAHPNSLALRFDGARALWTFGRRDEALAQFQAIIENLPNLSFDARTDPLLSHRIRVLAEMFPYGDFFRAALEPHTAGARAPSARDFVASSALVYIAADLCEREEWSPALGLLERAAERCPVNVAAWRFATRARHAAGSTPAATRDCFYRAVNLYPPEIFELMHIGIEAEFADGRTNEARDILRKWTLLHARTRRPDGTPLAVQSDALRAAVQHRDLLADWTGLLLDTIVAKA